TVLRRDGFQVFLAADGLEAVDVYRQSGRAIDVVLSDVRMNRLDGPQTLLALRKLNPLVRCIFMSGDPGDYTIPELLSLGACAFLEKPFSDLASISDTLRRAISQRRAA